jgi:hypothetical protein
MSDTILIAQKTHPLGGFYLAKLPDGSFQAGRTANEVRPYRSKAELMDVMSHYALTGHQWAWNICYELETVPE